MIHVFSTITESYQYSSELSFSLSLFKRSLPINAKLILIQRIGCEFSSPLRMALADSLNHDQLSEFILILKEPSLLMGKNTVSLLEHSLLQNPEFDCVLPSDFRGVPGSVYTPNYLTRRGFEAFVDGLSHIQDALSPYDGRDPFMFLIRSRAILNIEHIEDIFRLPHILRTRTAISPQAYIHPFFDYYMEKREDAANLVPKSVSSVLDIGCSRGRFGALLKSELGCRVVGIEMNPVEGKTARNVIDQVCIGDALQVNLDETFDCVTCLDVIEHFEDPIRLLARIRNEFLHDKGVLLLSIPNVGQWSIVEDLMAGRWDYLPVGILCNTHLRFFTRTSITEMLEENGFSIQKIIGNGITMPEDLKNKFRFLSNSGMLIDLPNLDVSNYMILAEKM